MDVEVVRDHVDIASGVSRRLLLHGREQVFSPFRPLESPEKAFFSTLLANDCLDTSSQRCSYTRTQKRGFAMTIPVDVPNAPVEIVSESSATDQSAIGAQRGERNPVAPLGNGNALRTQGDPGVGMPLGVQGDPGVGMPLGVQGDPGVGMPLGVQGDPGVGMPLGVQGDPGVGMPLGVQGDPGVGMPLGVQGDPGVGMPLGVQGDPGAGMPLGVQGHPQSHDSKGPEAVREGNPGSGLILGIQDESHSQVQSGRSTSAPSDAPTVGLPELLPE
jgi:hypothetical protein